MSLRSYNLRRLRRYGVGETGASALYYPTSGLVGYWTGPRLGSTVISDLSPNGYDATLSGTTKPSVPPVLAGGTSILFGPSSSYLSFSQPNSTYNLASFSVASWVYQAFTNNNISSMFDCNNQTNYGWTLNLNQNGAGSAASGYLSAYMYYSGAFHNAAYTNSALVSLGKWVHVCFTYANLGAATLYVNGSTTGITGSTPGAGITYASGGNVFSIGYNSGGSNQQFYGQLAELFMYNRALSSTEVLQLYNGVFS